MNFIIKLLVTVFLGLAAVSHADVITWTGLGDGVSLFQEANWVVEGGEVAPDAGTIDPGVPVPHDLVVNIAGTVGGAGGWNGTLDLGGVGTISVSTAYFRMSASSVIKDGSASVDSSSSFGYIRGGLDNADFVSSWGLNLSGPMHLINGSTLEATWFAGGNGVSSLNGGSTLTIREDAPGTFNNNMINFLDLGSKIVYNNLNRTIAEVESEHLSRFMVNGAEAVVGSNISIYKDGGTGFTTVQVIPEPGTLVLLVAGCLTLPFIRRRLV
ncbi:MAG: hypothetical protein ACO398_00010 [Kiritimatiellia bacterium]